MAEIEHLELLPRLFETAFIPAAAHEDSVDEPMFSALDEGEKAALMFYLQMNEDLLLWTSGKAWPQGPAAL